MERPTDLTLADCRPEVLAFAILVEKALRQRNPPEYPNIRYLLPTVADVRVELREAMEAYLKAHTAEGRDPAGPNEELLQELRDTATDKAAVLTQYVLQMIKAIGGFKTHR